MTSDSGSRPTGRDVEQARGEARQSGAKQSPIDHHKFDCMAEYAGQCWANALRAPGFHASHRTASGVDGPAGFNPISQGGRK